VAADVPHDVTTLLEEIRGGNTAARCRLVALVYDELRRLAVDLMRHERPGHTLQPTALAHEALLRPLRPEALANTGDRAQFLAAAARAMRQHLWITRAGEPRRSGGSGQEPVPLNGALDELPPQKMDILAVHEALNCLAELHERQSQVVELSFFDGYTMAEIAHLLEVSVSTVESDFRKAAAFLRRELAKGEGNDSGAL
jgi:RNA polymerase sigma factor (TIGR02999 family)